MAKKNWQTDTVAQICSSIDYGLTESAKALPIGPKFLRITDIVDGFIDWTTVPYCEITNEEKEKYQLCDGDIVIARTGATTGYSIFIKNPPDAVFASYLVRYKVKKDFDGRFVSYFLKSPDYWKYIKAVLGDKSAQPNASASTIAQVKIMYPPLPEQRAIAEVLGALDDKIELNRRMNRTLESIARAVFRAWFVENEQAQGWEVGKLGDIADVIDCLHSKKPERQQTGKPFLQLGNILANGLLDTSDVYFITQSDYDLWISRIEASPGDCVITNVGRVGAVAQIPEGFKAALGRNMTAIRCKQNYPYPTFLIECLLSDTMRQEINNKTDTGTILEALNVKNIPLLQFTLPPQSLLKTFERTARPIRAKMEQNLKESRMLASLRDSLLPKLMRGEVRVKV